MGNGVFLRLIKGVVGRRWVLMAENYTRTRFTVLFISCGSDADAVRFTRGEVEACLNFAGLTG
jgi:hypothetical protein